jgi:hypothetical protein
LPARRARSRRWFAGTLAATAASTLALVGVATPAHATPVAPGWLLERTGTNDLNYFAANDPFINSQYGGGAPCSAAQADAMDWTQYYPAVPLPNPNQIPSQSNKPKVPPCTDYRAEAIRSQIMDQPFAQWFANFGTDSIQPAVTSYVGAATGYYVPQLVPYWIPDRDCASLSTGGAPSGDWATYQVWIDKFAAGIKAGLLQSGNVNRPVLVMLEPDALALEPGDQNCDMIHGWSAGSAAAMAEVNNRHTNISLAVTKIKAAGSNVKVFLDAGHARWKNYSSNLPPMAQRLQAAGLAQADGFFTDTSNYSTLSEEQAYGVNLDKALMSLGITGKQQVIDTSRNGAMGNATTTDPQQGTGWPAWCDNANGLLGQFPPSLNVSESSDPGIAAYLWIKPPVETDGCFGNGNSAMAGKPPAMPLKVKAGAFNAARSCQLLGSACSFSGTIPNPVAPINLRATETTVNGGKAVLLEFLGSPGACAYDIVRDMGTPNQTWLGGGVQFIDQNPPLGTHTYTARGLLGVCLGNNPTTPWSAPATVTVT